MRCERWKLIFKRGQRAGSGRELKIIAEPEKRRDDLICKTKRNRIETKRRHQAIRCYNERHPSGSATTCKTTLVNHLRSFGEPAPPRSVVIQINDSINYNADVFAFDLQSFWSLQCCTIFCKDKQSRVVLNFKFLTKKIFLEKNRHQLFL